MRTKTPTATFEPFDVVVVPFPFSERAATKRRPALVVSSKDFNDGHGHLILAMITTGRRTVWPSDIEVDDLATAGLRERSVVRLKLFTLNERLVVRRIGTLASGSRNAVRRALRAQLAVGEDRLE